MVLLSILLYVVSVPLSISCLAKIDNKVKYYDAKQTILVCLIPAFNLLAVLAVVLYLLFTEGWVLLKPLYDHFNDNEPGKVIK